MTDTLEIPKVTDREIMIEHGAILKEVCRNVKEIKLTNSLQHEKIFERMDSIVDKKVSGKLFYSALSVIVTVLVIVCASIGLLNVKVTTTIADVEHIEHKINRIHPIE